MDSPNHVHPRIKVTVPDQALSLAAMAHIECPFDQVS